MAHFAELDANNVVISVVTVLKQNVLHDDELGDLEQKGIATL